MTVIALNPPTPKKWDRVRTNNKTLAIAIVIELIIVGAVLFASYQFAQRYSDGDNMQWWMAIICGIVYAMVELARVPLASGLLSGKYDKNTTFAATDHRSYNRDGRAFDVGETFSGVPFETGLVAAGEFGDLVRELAPADVTPAQAAIAWLAQQPAVTSVIPGARSVEQARANAAAGEVAPLGDAFDAGVRRIYDEHLREVIQPRW
jgi:hypothetical protein